NAIVPLVKSGKLRALAITSNARSPVLPDVPTLDEAGVAGVDVYSWQGVAAPKGLPADLKKKLYDGLAAALKDPQLRQQFESIGFEIVGNTPEQFAEFQKRESARWKKVIEAGNITAN
ncbi:MAG: Bug family tripartite tricarboxylate transporter substrate binding protein, partial [Gammaproteobacteria bacterium]